MKQRIRYEASRRGSMYKWIHVLIVKNKLSRIWHDNNEKKKQNWIAFVVKYTRVSRDLNAPFAKCNITSIARQIHTSCTCVFDPIQTYLAVIWDSTSMFQIVFFFLLSPMIFLFADSFYKRKKKLEILY